MASYEEEGADVDWGGRGWCWDGFDRSFLHPFFYVSHTPSFVVVFLILGQKKYCPGVVLSGRRTAKSMH